MRIKQIMNEDDQLKRYSSFPRQYLNRLFVVALFHVDKN